MKKYPWMSENSLTFANIIYPRTEIVILSESVVVTQVSVLLNQLLPAMVFSEKISWNASELQA